MIEDKELGVKIATNPLEKIWSTVKTRSETEIKVLEDSLIIQKAIFELAETKLKELSNA